MNIEQYEQEVSAQKMPYIEWLIIKDTELEKQYGRARVQSDLGMQIMRAIPFSSCMDSVQSCGEINDNEVYLFVRKGGCVSAFVMSVLIKPFLEDKDTLLVYADEDYEVTIDEYLDFAEDYFCLLDVPCVYDLIKCNYNRGAPWFKPDFSPDTLASFFYIGSMFAVQGSLVLRVIAKYGNDISIYELVYRIFMEALDRRLQGRKEGIVHIPLVLYTNNSFRKAGQIDCDKKIRELYAADNNAEEKGKVSIIIPSKDNAQVLRTCLETLTAYTEYGPYEIIIVDNGSSPEQRMCIKSALDALQQENAGLEIQYLYQKRDFNFSQMCNTGARAASGSFLLFLNDDIEIMETCEGRKWLDRMMVYAQKIHVGAVGAKLYYPPVHGEGEPGSYKIQHVGITNMGIGPAHKLGGMIDEECMYHGHNTQNYDMLAVTAACMLVRKSVFDEAGGFDETFPVAYNDVELCFRLYQRGYFNVQVNEAVLIHHESLSRGQDTSPEKQKRLFDEKERLYDKYPLLRANDPFYSPNLVQWKKDADYHTNLLFACDKIIRPRKRHGRKYNLRAMLYAKGRTAGKIYDRMTGYHLMMARIDHIETDITTITITGWCVYRNHDNVRMTRKLWLEKVTGSREVYEFDLPPKFREDVVQLFGDYAENGRHRKPRNVALAGIHLRFEKKELNPGTYQIKLLVNKRLLLHIEDENGNPIQVKI